MPKPFVGEIVLFHTSADDQGTYAEPTVLPAIISFVNPDGSVNLTVFNNSTHNTFRKNVPDGPGENQFSALPQDVAEVNLVAQEAK